MRHQQEKPKIPYLAGVGGAGRRRFKYLDRLARHRRGDNAAYRLAGLHQLDHLWLSCEQNWRLWCCRSPPQLIRKSRHRANTNRITVGALDDPVGGVVLVGHLDHPLEVVLPRPHSENWANLDVRPTQNGDRSAARTSESRHCFMPTPTPLSTRAKCNT